MTTLVHSPFFDTEFPRMDARLSLAIVIPFALVSCSSAPKQPVKQPGLDVFKQMISEPPAPSSIVRQGDMVTYLTVPTTAKPWLARFDASCSQPVAAMYYYPQGGGMRALSDSKESTSLPQPQLQILQRSEQLRTACAVRAVPDWRVLDTAQDQDWLALDRNSVDQEDGLLNVWTVRLLNRYQVGAENALIAQVHERLAIACTPRTFKRLSQFRIDATGWVFNGQLYGELQALTPALPASAEQRLIEAACQPAASWSTMATPPARKPLMPELQIPVANPSVLAAINALQLPEPPLNLHAVHYSYDTVILNGMKFSNLQREDVFTRDEQSGQLLLQPTDAALGITLRLTFRGLIDLASRSFDRRSAEQVSDTSPITGVSFKGDWQNLPEHTEVAYSLTRTSANKPYTNTINCTVGTARPASQINSALQGIAKPLNCTRLNTKRMQWTQSYSFLEDYGVFVLVSETSPIGQWRWRVDSLR